MSAESLRARLEALRPGDDSAGTTIVKLVSHPDPPNEDVLRIVGIATPELVDLWGHSVTDLRLALDVIEADLAIERHKDATFMNEGRLDLQHLAKLQLVRDTALDAFEAES